MPNTLPSEPNAPPPDTLADPQIEDRGLIERLGAQHYHRMGELQVGDAGLKRRVGQRPGQLRRGRRTRPAVQIA